MPADVHELSERISVVETGLEGLRNQIGGLGRSLEKYATDTDRSITTIGTRLSESARTPWGTLAAWASVVLAIGAVWMMGYVRDLERLEAALRSVDATQDAHQHDGHPARLEAMIIALQERALRIEDELRTVRSNRFTAADGLQLERRIERELDWLRSKLQRADAD